MDTLLYLVVAGAIAYWCYRQGKSIGSRKGFGIGLLRGRHHRRR